MKNNFIRIFILFILYQYSIAPTNLFGNSIESFKELRALNKPDDSLSYKLRFYRNGPTVGYGIGPIGVIDNTVSSEKYSGYAQSFDFLWTKVNRHNVFEYRFSSDISSKVSNYSVNSEISGFLLSNSVLFPAKKNHKLFTKEIFCFYGPALDFNLNLREQKFIENQISWPSISYLAFVSAGFRYKCIIPVSNKLSASASFKLGLISLASRMPDLNESDIPFFKLLAVPRTNFEFNYSIDYEVAKNIFLTGGYCFQYYNFKNMDDWKDFVMAKDIFHISITYKL
jgi:hypothetical protein